MAVPRISEAATRVTNVKALVYLDALALEDGESNADIAQRFPGAKIIDALRTQPFPQADGTEGTDFNIDPAAFLRCSPPTCPPASPRSWPPPSVCWRWPACRRTTSPAWKTIPSWYVIGRQDRVITPAAQRFMARRPHAHTVEIDSSRAVYVSHPAAVAALMLRPARAAG